MGISPSKQSLRIGELRTFLYIYAYARSHTIPVYIKCDDTNPDCTKSNLKILINEMRQIGLNFSHDELLYWKNSIIYQSENVEIYKKFLKLLEDMDVLSELNGLVSLDFKKSTHLILDKNIQGGDILRRSTKFNFEKTGYTYVPLYSSTNDRFFFHLPCVVDEYLMNTSISIRGEDKISLMPIHDVLRALLGFPKIKYLHTPLLLMPSSNKRIKGETYSLSTLLEKFPKNRLVSYILRSGYRVEYDRLVDIETFCRNFDATKIKKQSSRFDINDI